MHPDRSITKRLDRRAPIKPRREVESDEGISESRDAATLSIGLLERVAERVAKISIRTDGSAHSEEASVSTGPNNEQKVNLKQRTP
jgi:hypothetical protein